MTVEIVSTVTTWQRPYPTLPDVPGPAYTLAQILGERPYSFSYWRSYADGPDLITHLHSPLPGTAWTLGVIAPGVWSLDDERHAQTRAIDPFGPPVRNCRSHYCVASDGCGLCNRDIYRTCSAVYHGYQFRDYNRIPRAEVEEMRERTGAEEVVCTCWLECANCSEYLSPAYVITSGGESYCDSCDSQLFGYCSDHDERYDREEGCSDCNSGGYCRLVEDYSYKPHPIFHGPGPVYLGLEVEVGMASWHINPVAEYVAGRIGEMAYMKEDSSFTGFELVTHPMSYEWALEKFPWDMFDEMRSRWDLHNDPSAGIHVHVNRDGFTDAAHVYRWQKFFYRNRQPIVSVARRESGEWAAFRRSARTWALHHAKAGNQSINPDSVWDGWHHPRKGAWWVNEAISPSAKHNMRLGDGTPTHVNRYSAINVLNRHTFEVRIFAGSVYKSQIQAAMGLVHATVEYTRNLTARDILKNGGWDWAPFVAWVKENNESDRYGSLLAEIERLCA